MTSRSNSASPSSPWTTRAELRRTEIFRSLGVALQERGIAGITMGEIAQRLGMTKGSLYYYFKSKEDLLYQCHMRCVDVSLRALEASRARDLPADVRLKQVLVAHIRGITEEVYGAVLLSDLESLSPRRRQQYVARRDRFEAGVRALIEEGIRAGRFRKVDVRIASFAILGGINWISKWYDPRGQWSSAELAGRLAEFLVSGLRRERR